LIFRETKVLLVVKDLPENQVVQAPLDPPVKLVMMDPLDLV